MTWHKINYIVKKNANGCKQEVFMTSKYCETSSSQFIGDLKPNCKSLWYIVLH